ncbi:hypothetical protein [Pseudobacillus badius]|uniref:hypothetical protein n=1 Tax=Bacillus badius TaxID=1455 RepID=UPI0007B06F3D|nr:hypothetical protein [Bacillus badius]KZO00866.1 hypothetical protein A4244_14760 [Bacillus badius]OCS88796.1 hypothetical protein A6M11_14780 [Bacillus badius]OVE49602.1 hypothetical protein B1A98_16520 [Bacillus badius]TDW00982.1 hypothetical protein B0G66_11435 [Bacillus badius]
MLNIQSLSKQGAWRDGKNMNKLGDQLITEFQMADVSDADSAYQAALRAKEEWAKVNPYKI